MLFVKSEVDYDTSIQGIEPLVPQMEDGVTSCTPSSNRIAGNSTEQVTLLEGNLRRCLDDMRTCRGIDDFNGFKVFVFAQILTKSGARGGNEELLQDKKTLAINQTGGQAVCCSSNKENALFESPIREILLMNRQRASRTG